MIPVSTQAPALRRADGSPVRVLVVDDEPTLSELLAKRPSPARSGCPSAASQKLFHSRSF